MDDNRSTRLRGPDAVPDENAGVDVDVEPAVDTDGDGVPDTLLTTELTADGADLLVHTDLDADGVAERVFRIGPDGAVHTDPVPGVAAAGPVTGSVRAEWPGLLGRLFGPGP
ncbi:hypothetical protein [Pseudonocardia charpentierae]|uniref:Uncharacterized protein n=1 Tax=Pseudonocardia charpentierae TaxID=3075545 RepID=A0ABU2N3D4_9PSEU|nr:hypothetical protein [Pseudonocardia sp. DSM 45834]MDT0348256.1 hypothetical protein [Pseudonocardia sp. DSM 45834]